MVFVLLVLDFLITWGVLHVAGEIGVALGLLDNCTAAGSAAFAVVWKLLKLI